MYLTSLIISYPGETEYTGESSDEVALAKGALAYDYKIAERYVQKLMKDVFDKKMLEGQIKG